MESCSEKNHNEDKAKFQGKFFKNYPKYIGKIIAVYQFLLNSYLIFSFFVCK